MVHALEEIHRVTRPAGTVIEIHPALEFPFLEVRSNEELSFSEDDPGFDYGEDSLHAETAVATVVGRGLFVLDDRRRFELRTHASSLQELRDHWAVADAYDPEEKEETLARARKRCTPGHMRSSSARPAPSSCSSSRRRCRA